MADEIGMVERVARAMAIKAGIDWDKLAEGEGSMWFKYWWRELARTAHAALSEDKPTPTKNGGEG